MLKWFFNLGKSISGPHTASGAWMSAVATMSATASHGGVLTVTSDLYAQHAQLGIITAVGARHRWPFALRSDFVEANDRAVFSYDHSTGLMSVAGRRWSASVKNVSTNATSITTLGTVTIPAALIEVGTMIRFTWYMDINTTPAGTFTVQIEAEGTDLDLGFFATLSDDFRGYGDLIIDDADVSGSAIITMQKTQLTGDVHTQDIGTQTGIDFSGDTDIALRALVTNAADTITIPGFHVEVLT